jgi:hypothetical protein
MTGFTLSAPAPGRYTSIRIDGNGQVATFAGQTELHLDAVTNTYSVSMRDGSEPSGRRLVWQQRATDGRTEVVTITVR